MGRNERGFDKLVGETITFIDTSAINVVHFHTQSGKIVSVDAEQSHFGIPVINAENNYEVLKND